MLPTDANSMAAKMVERLKHARNSASRPGLRDARIIPQYASDDIRPQSAASTKQRAFITCLGRNLATWSSGPRRRGFLTEFVAEEAALMQADWWRSSGPLGACHDSDRVARPSTVGLRNRLSFVQASRRFSATDGVSPSIYGDGTQRSARDRSSSRSPDER